MKCLHALACLLVLSAAAPVVTAQPDIAPADAVDGVTSADAGVLSRDDDETASSAKPAPKPLRQLLVGARLRYVTLPHSMIEWFVERAPGGSGNAGFGADVSWRRGNGEWTLGLGWDRLAAPEGIYVELDTAPPADEVDYVTDDGFGWIALDINYTGYIPVMKQLALRYGGGLGIGVVVGDIRRTDYVCTSSALTTCIAKPGAEHVNDPYDIPPVLPILSGYLGAQFRPTAGTAVNLDLGLRTAPALTLSVQVAL